MTDAVLFSTDERGLSTVTLNRPEKHNAFDDVIIDQLTTVFQKISADKSTRAMLLCGNGKSFSAGADLEWMKRMATFTVEQNHDDARRLAIMLRTLNELPVPTIARVHGAAFGGAVGLVSCCDMAIGTASAGFSLSEVKIGLIPATISPYVVAAIGQRAARRYFLTAERFDAEEAKRLSLLNMVVPEQDLDHRIDELIDAIVANGPAAVMAAKQLISDVDGRPINDQLVEETSARIASARASLEGQEGLNAFLEKRTPRWLKVTET